MDAKDSITLIVGIAAIVIAYSQMRIASAKTKLDLYNKRFDVYRAALAYYQATWHEPPDGIKEKQKAFVISYRESLFLFNKKDGIHKTLEKILQNGSIICGYEERKYEVENNISDDRGASTDLHTTSIEQRAEFEKNLECLEGQIEKYIQFKTVAAWHFWG